MSTSENSGAASKGRRTGRRPLPRAKIERAIQLVRTGISVSQAARELGIHRNSIGSYLKREAPELLRDNFGRHFRTRKTMTDYLSPLIPKHIPPEIREELIQDMVLDLLERPNVTAKISHNMKSLQRRFNMQYRDKWKSVSLETPIGETGLTIADTLEG